MNEKSKRMIELDIMKGLLIIGVVIGHLGNEWVMPWVHNFIYSFHIPVLFFLAGLTTNFNNKEKMVERTKKLMQVYLFWGGVFLAYNIGIRMLIMHHDISWFISTVIEFSSFKGISVMWFVSALLGSVVFLYCLKIFKLKNRDIWLVELFLFLSIYVVSNVVDLEEIINYRDSYGTYYVVSVLVFVLHVISVGLFVYSGFIMKNKLFGLINRIGELKFWTKIVLIFGMTCICVFISNICPVIDFNSIKLGNVLGVMICTFLGLIICVMLADIIKKITLLSKLFQFWGKNSLLIMATHFYIPIITLAKILCLRLNIVNWFVAITIVMMIESILIVIYHFCKEKMKKRKLESI